MPSGPQPSCVCAVVIRQLVLRTQKRRLRLCCGEVHVVPTPERFKQPDYPQSNSPFSVPSSCKVSLREMIGKAGEAYCPPGVSGRWTITSNAGCLSTNGLPSRPAGDGFCLASNRSVELLDTLAVTLYRCEPAKADFMGRPSASQQNFLPPHKSDVCLLVQQALYRKGHNVLILQDCPYESLAH